MTGPRSPCGENWVLCVAEAELTRRIHRKETQERPHHEGEEERSEDEASIDCCAATVAGRYFQSLVCNLLGVSVVIGSRSLIGIGHRCVCARTKELEGQQPTRAGSYRAERRVPC
jgi:hypothetical protein